VICISAENFEEEYALPLVPSEAETKLALQLGVEGLRTIDGNLVRHAQRRSLKALRVVCDAMTAVLSHSTTKPAPSCTSGGSSAW
jgi:hypothetical protein